MDQELTRFDLWLLRRIFRKVMVQGNHRNRIERTYSMIREAFEATFTEDNRATQEAFLWNCFKADIAGLDARRKF